jgi:tetratricopeptide (TPR) repeat protein
LLQQLSVIGRQFPLSLIRQVIAQPEADLYRLLASLQHKEFLYEQPAFSESEYIFKHALTQDVAYGTVLQEQRKLLHERSGQAVEQLYKDKIEERYSELAHHYQRSGNTEKAVEYLQKAGQQAAQRSANTEAITHLTAALDLLLTQPETRERAAQELTLRLAVGPALMSTLGFAAPAVEQHYTRARALGAQLNDASQRVPVLFGLYLFHLTRGELRTTQALTEECLQLAEQTHEAELLLEAHTAVGATFLWRGEFVRARAAHEQSRAFYHSQNQALPSLHSGFHPRGHSLSLAALALWYLGYPEQSRTRIDEGLHLAQEFAHPFNLAQSLFIAAELYGERGDGHLAQEYADAEVAVSREHGFPVYLTFGTVHQGKMLMTWGQWAEGVTQVKQGLVLRQCEDEGLSLRAQRGNLWGDTS